MVFGFQRETPFHVILSFEALLRMWEDRIARANTGNESADAKLLSAVNAVAAFKVGMDSDAAIDRNKEVLEKLFQDLFPEAFSNTEIKAVGIPHTNTIFNHTRRFKEILAAAGSDFRLNLFDGDDHHNYIACCCFILNRHYDTQIDLGRPLTVQIPGANGVNKYYRVLYNTDFLEVNPGDKQVPINNGELQLLLNNYDDIALWKRFFPPGSWILKGFAIMTMIDVTTEHVISLLKEKLMALETENFKEVITDVFRSFFNMPEITVGFTLIEPVTAQLQPAIFNHQNLSFLLSSGNTISDRDILSDASYERLVKDKKYFFLYNVAAFYEQDEKNKLARLLTSKGVGSLLLAPVLKNGKLLGILEIMSQQTNRLDSVNTQKLEILLPFLGDAVERLMTRFALQVETTLQQFYTRIHPSIKWRFFRAAEKYIYRNELGIPNNLQEIVLEGVYPLYGQVDIKGSTRKRNESVQQDLINNLRSLNDSIATHSLNNFLTAEIPSIQLLIGQVQNAFAADTEEKVKTYLETQVYPKLNGQPGDKYSDGFENFLADREQGKFYEHRRKHDESIAMINANLAGVLLQAQSQAQRAHPHYFEYSKTDGVEHTLYIGKTIDPSGHFTLHHLQELRKWQIETLCKMVNAHQVLQPRLPYPLQVTALILAYTTPVTIRFRMDEKRFDVDGANDIKFEVIKKRIEKACIKGTSERITQPGKLTVVYTSPLEAEEYRKYLEEAFRADRLNNNIEMFELQDLQDISGLKALRAGFSQAVLNGGLT